MKKIETVTQTREVYYCDKCGKKLNKKELERSGPWVCLHYLTKYDKPSEEHDSFSLGLDLCDECNIELSKLVLEEWYKFTEKFTKYKKN